MRLIKEQQEIDRESELTGKTYWFVHKKTEIINLIKCKVQFTST